MMQVKHKAAWIVLLVLLLCLPAGCGQVGGAGVPDGGGAADGDGQSPASVQAGGASTTSAPASPPASAEGTTATSDGNASASPAAGASDDTKRTPEPSAATSSEGGSGQADADAGTGDMPTPWQFFAMMAGNAEALSFSYTVTPVEGEAWTATYARQGDRARAVYTAFDMNGNPVRVEEFAADGATWFALPQQRVLHRFEGIGDHLVEAEMLRAVNGTASDTVAQGDTAVTTYTVALPQDPDTPVAYRFTMGPDGPVRVEVSVGGEPHHTIDFGPMSSEAVPEADLQLPEGYRTERYDYPYEQAHMPPWWDGGNDM